MRSKEELKKHFKDHIAILQKLNDTISILDWRKPETNNYYVRYVFDGCRVYITGDLGDAILNLTWVATVESFKNIDVGYLHGKLSAYHDDKKEFNEDTAIENIKYYLTEYFEPKDDFERERNEQLIKDLIETLESCSTKDGWENEINEYYEYRLKEVDEDCWDWIYSVGDEIPGRFRMYLIGLQMAGDQLEKNGELEHQGKFEKAIMDRFNRVD